MKFGGSSVADADRILGVAKIVQQRLGRRPVVVVSALAGVTDLLERALDASRQGDRERLEPILADLERRHRWALAGCVEDAGLRHSLSLELDRLFEDLRQRLRSMRILREGTPRARDAVMAFGENLSARIVAHAFRDRGLPARRVDPEGVMATDDRFGQAEPQLERVRDGCRERVLPVLQAGELPVLGGYVGASRSGDTTTLGRGGSDTSAAVLGLALEAEEIQIWTDVDGLMSADPRLVPAARNLPRVSFAEAAELAHYGARVLHPDSIAPAVRRRIPVRVLNALRPEGSGTLIVGDEPNNGDVRPVAIASRQPASIVRATSNRMRREAVLLPRMLESCAVAGIVPAFVLASDVAVTLAVPGRVERTTIEGPLGAGLDLEVGQDKAIVSVVGSGLAGPGPLRGRVLAELGRWEPEMVAMGASRASVAMVLRQAELERVLRQLHRRFLEEDGRD